MIISMKCDGCGLIGGEDRISTDWDGKDLCEGCLKKSRIEELEEKILTKTKWLNETHLRELKEMQAALQSLKAL